MLGLVQEWLAADRPAGERLAVVTRGAVPVAAGEGVTDLAGAAVWGLVRSAQSENPGRLILADLPPGGGDEVGGDEQLAAALASDEPELAIRDGQVYARRLVRPSGALVPPGGGGPWRLETTGTGTLDGLALVPCPQAAAPLEPGQVRVAVRAAGLNFRDVLIGLGMYPGGGIIGSELAGVVLDTGPGVTGLTRGDRVTGLTEGGFGPVTVTRAPLLTRIPAGWSFARAASVPIVFATAWYALADLAASASRPEAPGPRGRRRGRHGRGGHRPASRPGGLRHRLRRASTPCWPAWAWTRPISRPRGTPGSRRSSSPPPAAPAWTSC